MNKHMRAEECIHCHQCQRHCEFLKKYGIDIGDTGELAGLAYHCFLCGKCTEVCPKGIDGRNYILELRRKQVEKNQGKLQQKGYGMLLREKKNYIFQNYKHAGTKSILFPGCNFPSFYPKTLKKLVELLEERDIGVGYDCCGKPVAELGLAEEEERIIAELNDRILHYGVEEVIMVCPNCYAYLKPHLKVKIISIYDKLKELGIGNCNLKEGKVFLPCPDRESQEMLEGIHAFTSGALTPLGQVQCCGLGGCAPVTEPELAKKMAESMKEEGAGKIYSYCASCAGNLTRNGCGNISHVLTEILGTYERPDVGKSALNRARTRFR